MQHRGELVAVEGDDRVAEALAGVEVAGGRKGVVDAFGPAFFFEGREDEFLVAGGVAETLDERAVEVEFVEVGVPDGLRAELGTGGCGLGLP